MISCQTLVSYRDPHKSLSITFSPRFIPFTTPHHTLLLSFLALDFFSTVKLHPRSFHYLTLKQNFILDHCILYPFRLLCWSCSTLWINHSAAYLAKFIFSFVYLWLCVCVWERESFLIWLSLSLSHCLTAWDYWVCSALCYRLRIFLFLYTNLVSQELWIFFIWEYVFGRQSQLKCDFVRAQVTPKQKWTLCTLNSVRRVFPEEKTSELRPEGWEWCWRRTRKLWETIPCREKQVPESERVPDVSRTSLLLDLRIGKRHADDEDEGSLGSCHEGIKTVEWRNLGTLCCFRLQICPDVGCGRITQDAMWQKDWSTLDWPQGGWLFIWVY